MDAIEVFVIVVWMLLWVVIRGRCCPGAVGII